MEVRDIYYRGNHVATLDYNKSTGAWFLDTQELVKLSRVPNVVDLILAEREKIASRVSFLRRLFAFLFLKETSQMMMSLKRGSLKFLRHLPAVRW